MIELSKPSRWTLVLLTTLAVGTLTGCDKIKGMIESKVKQATQEAVPAPPAAPQPEAAPVTPPPAAEPAAAVPAAPALPSGGSEEEKLRYINAAALSACAAVREPTKAVEATLQVVQANGFADALAYAEAGKRYLSDPAVAQAISVRRAECLAAATAQAAAAQASAPAEGAKAEVPPATPEVPEPAKEEEPEAPPLAGRWAGNLMGSHTGSLTFTVGLDQKAISGGQVRGKGFSGGFIGVIQGTTVRINAKGGSGITATMEGSLNPTTKRMSGTWKGVVNNHRADGSWSAALAK